jgi:undecaprenyl diphosphate synthase
VSHTISNYSQLIDMDKLPQHIAIIMDGNGRWAKKRFMPRTFGHRAGMSSLKQVVETCSELGISCLTVFAFSTENWKRPHDEISYLMSLLVEYINKELKELHQNGIHIKVLGDYRNLPPASVQAIDKAVQKTAANQGMVLNIAINYGARDEIIKAVQQIATQVKQGQLEPEDINEYHFKRFLYTAGLPDPDLLIRTAGEMRISNFLLWQIAYAELWFSPVMWPEFNREELLKAIWEFQQRDRRFGGLNVDGQGDSYA